MKIPENTFLAKLRKGVPQIGLWVGLADPNVAELLATTGFDWLLLDAEHGPNNPITILSQLRAVAPYPVQSVVRPVQGDVALVKQYLDVGAQTLLLPMIDTADHAKLMVSATRYPPEGIRGMGASLARAARWNQVENYIEEANDQICLLVQAESTQAIQNLDAILAVNGIDGIFFGPADLSAAMGYRGQPGHPEVQKVILEGIRKVKAAGKAAGVLATDPKLANLYLDAGAIFVAVGVDTSLLVRSASELAKIFKVNLTFNKPATGGGY